MRRLALSHGAQASSVAVGAEEGPRCSAGVGSRGESTRRALRVETVRRVCGSDSRSLRRVTLTRRITGTTIPELDQDQAPGKRPALW